jgi:hypothetical protein
MKRQHIASMVIVSASVVVVGITLAAQDRFTLEIAKRDRVLGVPGLRGVAGDCLGTIR